MYHESEKYNFASSLHNGTGHLCAKQLFSASVQLFSGAGKIIFDIDLDLYHNFMHARNEGSRNVQLIQASAGPI